MSRIKISMPPAFGFSICIPIRITDINYGGHVGNDTVLSLMHEARVQFLNSKGYGELNIEGTSLIMADAGIEFKKELFYGDLIEVFVAAADFSKVAFSLFYKLERKLPHTNELVALGKTGMICYDYTEKKIKAIPEKALEKLKS